MQSKEQTPHINVDYFEDLTGDIAGAERKGIPEIGRRIRSLREEKGLTLEAVAEATGFDVGHLSRIENNEVQPQLGTIMKLSKALDGAFSRLVSGPGDKPYAITRKAERKPVSRSTSRKGQRNLYTYKSLAPEVQGRHMEALIVQLEENPDEETSQHGGEEFIFVIEGVAVLKVGDERFELEPGDSAYYLSSTPHLIAAREGSATILAVIHGG